MLSVGGLFNIFALVHLPKEARILNKFRAEQCQTPSCDSQDKRPNPQLERSWRILPFPLLS